MERGPLSAHTASITSVKPLIQFRKMIPTKFVVRIIVSNAIPNRAAVARISHSCPGRIRVSTGNANELDVTNSLLVWFDLSKCSG